MVIKRNEKIENEKKVFGSRVYIRRNLCRSVDHTNAAGLLLIVAGLIMAVVQFISNRGMIHEHVNRIGNRQHRY